MKIDFNNIYKQDKILFPKIINDIKKTIKKTIDKIRYKLHMIIYLRY